MTTKPGFLIFEFVSFLPDISTDDRKGAEGVWFVNEPQKLLKNLQAFPPDLLISQPDTPQPFPLRLKRGVTGNESPENGILTPTFWDMQWPIGPPVPCLEALNKAVPWWWYLKCIFCFTCKMFWKIPIFDLPHAPYVNANVARMLWGSTNRGANKKIHSHTQM